MAVTRKPRINLKNNADSFIDNAKANGKSTVKSSGKSNVRSTVKDGGKPNVKNVRDMIEQAASKKAVKPKKLTYYMPPEKHQLWKKYEFEQLQAGRKITFQGVVDAVMNELLGWRD